MFFDYSLILKKRMIDRVYDVFYLDYSKQGFGGRYDTISHGFLPSAGFLLCGDPLLASKLLIL